MIVRLFSLAISLSVSTLTAYVALSGHCVWSAPTSAPTTAPLSLASIFTDHMVLQRDTKLPIWGKATPGTAVVIELDLKTTGTAKASATAGKDGRWETEIGPLPAGGPCTVSIESMGVTK